MKTRIFVFTAIFTVTMATVLVTRQGQVTKAKEVQIPELEGWSNPVNLGPVINSDADDSAAALSKDGLTLYFTSNQGSTSLDKSAPAKYRGIGIRIEDDVVVTETGNLNLTAKVPKDPDAIEALMNKR